jgi:hypothetical protein
VQAESAVKAGGLLFYGSVTSIASRACNEKRIPLNGIRKVYPIVYSMRPW